VEPDQGLAQQQPEVALVGDGGDLGFALLDQGVDLGHADGQPVAQQLADAPRVALVG
jgi:hypothetical protein